MGTSGGEVLPHPRLEDGWSILLTQIWAEGGRPPGMPVELAAGSDAGARPSDEVVVHAEND